MVVAASALIARFSKRPSGKFSRHTCQKDTNRQSFMSNSREVSVSLMSTPFCALGSRCEAQSECCEAGSTCNENQRGNHHAGSRAHHVFLEDREDRLCFA